ncbi:MAG: hypothetical protein PVF47_02760 [Anaerolineae bacterium]
MPEPGNDGDQTQIRDDGGAELAPAIAEIDLQALAEAVYALLRQELRLERERRGWHKVW